MGWKKDVKNAGGLLLGGSAGIGLGSVLGGLSGSPETANLDALASSQREIAQEQLAFAREESAAARARQAEFDPIYKDLIEQAIASTRTADERSAAEWDRYTTTFQPVEDKMVKSALDYDSEGRRNEAASAAAADVGLRFDQAKQAREADIRRGGGTTTSTLDSGYIEQAKATAAASTGARRAVEATGLQLVDNAARFGRGLASTGLQAQNLALGANQTAQGGLAGNQSTYNASLAPAQQFYGGAVGANSSAGSLLSSIIKAEGDADANTMAGLGSIATLGATLY